MQRQVAYKLWIKDILNAEPALDKDGNRQFIVRGKNVIRVNIIATVINIYSNPEKGYASIILDDSSGQISVKAWDTDVLLLNGISVGDSVIVIGRLHLQDSGIFLRPEIVKKLNPLWIKARIMELQKNYGQPQPPPSVITEEVIKEDNAMPSTLAREKVISLLESSQEALSVEEVIAKSGLKRGDAEFAIEELMKEGEIFAPQKGYIKLI